MAYLNIAAANDEQKRKLGQFAKQAKELNDAGKNSEYEALIEQIDTFLRAQENIGLIVSTFPRPCCDMGRNGAFYKELQAANAVFLAASAGKKDKDRTSPQA